MVIQSVHTQVQVSTIRSAQYEYRRHTISSQRDSKKFFRSLPLVPHDLEVLILRPHDWNEDPNMRRQFVRGLSHLTLSRAKAAQSTQSLTRSTRIMFSAFLAMCSSGRKKMQMVTMSSGSAP
ncbi:hypothetical protein HDK77DRAFT_452125 [Phyllosticta capitalensis]